MFAGFTEETIRFFLDIRFHNDISYFKSHENEYRQHVKEPFFSFIQAMSPTLQLIADDMELRPEKALARIRRDTRFTKDKSPFRDHLWILFRRTGEPRDTAVMYWFELSPEDVAWGVGFWDANRPAMDVLRETMLRKPSVFLSVLEECGLPEEGLQLYGDAFRRMKIPPEVPDLLKPYFPLKSIHIKRTNISFRQVYTPELIHLVSKDFLRLKPMYSLLRSAADEGLAKLEG